VVTWSACWCSPLELSGLELEIIHKHGLEVGSKVKTNHEREYNYACAQQCNRYSDYFLALDDQDYSDEEQQNPKRHCGERNRIHLLFGSYTL
jgi:hypothetical protein